MRASPPRIQNMSKPRSASRDTSRCDAAGEGDGSAVAGAAVETESEATVFTSGREGYIEVGGGMDCVNDRIWECWRLACDFPGWAVRPRAAGVRRTPSAARGAAGPLRTLGARNRDA